ncbi:DUF2116 family Zn-ribbon domain-containing protein [uncultured Pseudomonas sp.]|uniref:DUF2116 family Zn-ribbon domain-containing protein n=1 Tax=uncultured Pseudomonas sp. TaxID=114707 RepID=UPI003443F6A7
MSLKFKFHLTEGGLTVAVVIRQCIICGADIETKRFTRKTCSDRCRTKLRRSRNTTYELIK